MDRRVKVAVLDNAVDHRVYTPIDHWSPYLDVPWQAFDARQGRLPALGDGFSHVIITGSESSVLEREPWAEEEAEFVRDAAARGLALLGSCWGHQLLAFAFDGESAVRRCPEPEIGWIRIDQPGPSGLLGPEPSAYTFSLHFDEVTNASGRFHVLASTSVCTVQAMALPGARVWGLQIHPEIDIAWARKIMRAMSGRGRRGDALFEAALASEPRDSGLIYNIVNYFLNS